MNETRDLVSVMDGVLWSVRLFVVALVAAAPAISSPLQLQVQSYEAFDPVSYTHLTLPTKA